MERPVFAMIAAFCGRSQTQSGFDPRILPARRL